MDDILYKLKAKQSCLYLPFKNIFYIYTNKDRHQWLTNTCIQCYGLKGFDLLLFYLAIFIYPYVI